MADSADQNQLERVETISDEKEEEILFFDTEDIKSGLEDCSKSVVRMLLVDKSFSLGTVEKALGAIWG